MQHVHLLGVCGTGMAGLATLFVEAGWRVTGSDQKTYPPMSELLSDLGIPVFEGYDPKNLAEHPDLVIVGNALAKTNPEVQEMLRLGLPYRSLPAALTEYFLVHRSPLVVAGTHGKTTTSSLLTWLLTSAEEEPGFLIGGLCKNFNGNARMGRGPSFVIEGDEYDTAFFDKEPKFLHYRPQAAILTSIEFDHADIYRDLDHMKEAYRKFVQTMPPDGLLVTCADAPHAMHIAGTSPARVVTYSATQDANYRATVDSIGPHGTTFTLTTPSGQDTFVSPLFGQHNLANATAVLALLLESGIPAGRLRKGLETFLGVKRRQEVVGEAKGITIIDDFAHHPTAVAETIAAMRAQYPKRRLWAVFEPRSNTSRRNIFLKEYVSALAKADRVVIAGVYNADKVPEGERLNTQQLADRLMGRGVDAHFIPETKYIQEYVIRNIDAGDVVLIMSNGGFDGIHHKILGSIERRRIVTDMSKVRSSKIPKPRAREGL